VWPAQIRCLIRQHHMPICRHLSGVKSGYDRSLSWLQDNPRNRLFMRFLGGAEGEGFEPSRDGTAPNGFRDSFHLAQPCALRPGARHNARQFAPRGLERTDRIGTMWASSRLLRLKIESQLRERARPSRLRPLATAVLVVTTLRREKWIAPSS
jgi:hypothetical protein